MQRNPITLELLEMLDAIDRRGSFAKAAEELNKATSAISYAVQKIEEQLDVALFQRQGRRSVLTPAGRLMLNEGRHILLAASHLANQAKEVATGWETRIRIAVESLHNYSAFFAVLEAFMQAHASMELDISECVLNGGWEALEQDRVDLIVGVPGPIPLQKGYRAIPINQSDLVPVIAATHEHARCASAVDELRRVIVHDTSTSHIPRSAGLASGGRNLYVQTIEQKEQAILAGLGVGHLPRHRISKRLEDGTLVELPLDGIINHEQFVAWKISNKGKGLQALSSALAQARQ
ncbi:LysR family transcriptional regulator [Halioglobus maricola]|uniref:LysR family transcriptional regulator n=1 Tax=Halioglobus maricola TaxID=2601894 RepID=A0A5P9NMY4_9GAMM|nr:LysR family transcriptional regulator [Halioglobus maricola]QFU76288.1 LysR family transcriptional regulator [Halioglobus maricola]